MQEIHDIMIQYVIKLNVIKKFYLMNEEIYRAIEGDVWRLIY